MIAWTVDDIPDLTGKVVIITGGSNGLGLESARALARHNATVVIASSTPDRGNDARARVQTDAPAATVTYMELDLADLQSVRAFSDAFKSQYRRLDILMNNAAVTWVPAGKTKDGFERHIGINFLGHYALTGHLLDLLLNTPQSRVVTLTSRLYRQAELDLDDLMSAGDYKPAAAYGASKLANLLFHFELQRKLTAAGAATRAVAAHPGMAATGWADEIAGLQGKLMRAITPFLLPSPAKMAQYQLYAAAGAAVQPGGFYGPEKETKGSIAAVEAGAVAGDELRAARLWQTAEELTGVTYQFR